jgi:hypothetical protein
VLTPVSQDRTFTSRELTYYVELLVLPSSEMNEKINHSSESIRSDWSCLAGPVDHILEVVTIDGVLDWVIGFIDILYTQFLTAGNITLSPIYTIYRSQLHTDQCSQSSLVISGQRIYNSLTVTTAHKKYSFHRLIPFLPFLLNHFRLPTLETESESESEFESESYVTTDGQSASLELTTKLLLLSDSCGFVDVGRSLSLEDGPVVHNFCRPSLAQSF